MCTKCTVTYYHYMIQILVIFYKVTLQGGGLNRSFLFSAMAFYSYLLQTELTEEAIAGVSEQVAVITTNTEVTVILSLFNCQDIELCLLKYFIYKYIKEICIFIFVAS